MNNIKLPKNAVAYAFTCPADGSYVGFLDERLGRWRYFQILGKGNALEPVFRAGLINEERSVRLGRLECELGEGQFRRFAPI
jgi:hypothetical protein